jgi:hypothetical protein
MFQATGYSSERSLLSPLYRGNSMQTNLGAVEPFKRSELAQLACTSATDGDGLQRFKRDHVKFSGHDLQVESNHAVSNLRFNTSAMQRRAFISGPARKDRFITGKNSCPLPEKISSLSDDTNENEFEGKRADLVAKPPKKVLQQKKR